MAQATSWIKTVEKEKLSKPGRSQLKNQVIHLMYYFHFAQDMTNNPGNQLH